MDLPSSFNRASQRSEATGSDDKPEVSLFVWRLRLSFSQKSAFSNQAQRRSKRSAERRSACADGYGLNEESVAFLEPDNKLHPQDACSNCKLYQVCWGFGFDQFQVKFILQDFEDVRCNERRCNWPNPNSLDV